MKGKSDWCFLQKESVDMKKAVRTMKNVIDEQQAELEALKRQNANMRSVIQQTVDQRDRISVSVSLSDNLWLWS